MTFFSFIWILFISYCLSNLGNWLTIQLAKRHHLFEARDYRKTHTEKVAALGGIPIFVILLCMSFFSNSGYDSFFLIMGAASLLFGISLWDDLKNIGVKRRLFTQFLVANIVFFAGLDFNLSGMVVNEMVNYGLTVGFICLMINGTNFIDGINGLSGSMGLMATLFFLVIFTLYDAQEYAFLVAVYAGALLGFLRYNFGKRAAIFMGDNGSTVLGFLLAIFFLKSWSLLGNTANDFRFLNCSIVLIALPIMDLFGVVLIRLFKRQSPFKADRIHLHHLLTEKGKTHPGACRFILFWLISLMVIFYFNLLNTYPFILSVIFGSYLLLRIWYSNVKFPAIFLSKWDKPVPQQL